jgi:membrane protein YqaA with SNARE-associated domain
MLTAYLALFAWSFLAATILPLASEPMLIALVRMRGDLVGPVVVATAGNYLGASTTYWLARAAASRFGVPPSTRTRERRAMALLTRFGQPALLLSWVPIVGDAIVAVAGVLAIPFVAFSLWTLLGKAARYAAVAWIAAQA